MSNNVHFDLHFNGDEVPYNVSSVTIHPSVATIRRKAFLSCYELQSINLPDSITHVGNRAFWGCSLLQSIYLPDSITTVGSYAFYRCCQLQLVALPESLEVHSSVFCQCHALEARLPNGQNYNNNIITWLRQRFTNLPLHQQFYKTTDTSTTTTQTLLTNLIQQYKSTLTTTDAMGMTPLHVLCANPSATSLKMVQILRDAQPDAASMRTVIGHTPLMMMLHSKGIQYNDYYDGADRELVLRPLVGLLERGLDYSALETILIFDEMQLMSEIDVEDQASGLLPFMYAASLAKCSLDVVYKLAIQRPDLLCKKIEYNDVSHVAKRQKLE